MTTPSWRRRRPIASSGAALCAAFFCACEPATAQSPTSPALPPRPAWVAMPASLLPMRLPVEAGPAWTVEGSAVDFEAADPVPVRGVSGDWSRYSPRHGQNEALQSARVELGASRSGWEVAATLRSEFQIVGPRSTFDAVHAYKQRQTPPDGTRFAIDAHETGVVWAGLRGARTWILQPGFDQSLQFTGALSIVSVRRVQQVDATGQVQFDTAAGYGFQAEAQRHDSHAQFGGYGQKGALGSGYTTDLGLLWQPTAWAFVNLSAVDVLSRLRVRNVSTQQATLSSSTNAYDADGYLAYQPLVVGRFSAADVKLELARKWSASAGTRIGWRGRDVLLGGRWERIGHLDLPALWAMLPLTPGLALQFDGEFRFRSIGIGLTTRHGVLMLRTCSLPVGQSHAIGWQAGFSVPF